jgi:hypothetical protein
MVQKMENIKLVCQCFKIAGKVNEIKPFGEGLINSSYRVTLKDSLAEYVLQKINQHIFKDVEMLQNNIYRITSHIRKKLEEKGEIDIEHRCPDFSILIHIKCIRLDRHSNQLLVESRIVL